MADKYPFQDHHLIPGYCGPGNFRISERDGTFTPDIGLFEPVSCRDQEFQPPKSLVVKLRVKPELQRTVAFILKSVPRKMAPGYRNNQSRRQNRGLVDHDIFEGLPVRNWRRDTVTVAPPPAHDPFANVKDKWDVELPWGMPKDAHLMPQHSQDLLRLARSGRIYQKRPAVEEEDQEADQLPADKPEKKELDLKEEGFSVKTWKLVPKHLEGPEIEYLAKRRKGLKGSAIKDGSAQGVTITKMTLRKTDERGNTYVEDVLVPEGQAVEGEVIAQTVVTDPAITADSAGVVAQPQPVKRRPPPPKRKAKGPGRGRRKKLPLPQTSVPAEVGAAPVAGQALEAPKQEAAVGADGVKIETTTASGNEDTEMRDGSVAQSDDEGDEGEDASDDDDQDGEGEGSQADDNDREDDRDRMILDNLPSEPKMAPPRPAISDFPLESPSGPFGQGTNHSPPASGSPLKHAFTPQSYSPTISAAQSEGKIHDEEEEAEGDADEQPHDRQFEQHQQQDDRLDQQQQSFRREDEQHQFEPQHHQESLPHTASNVQDAHAPQEGYEASPTDFQDMLSSTPPTFNEHGDDQMLLDDAAEEHDELPDMTDFDPNMLAAEAADGDAQQEAHEVDDEKFEDLLGSLEDHLNEGDVPAAESPAVGVAEAVGEQKDVDAVEAAAPVAETQEAVVVVEASTVGVVEIQDEVVEAVEERAVEVVEEETVAEVAEQTVEEVAEPAVEEMAEPAVEGVAEPTVTEVAEQTVTEVAEQTVEEAAEQTVTEVAEQTVEEAAEQTVTEVAEQTVEEVAEPIVEEVAEPTVTEVAEQTVGDVTDQAVAKAAEQAVAEVAEKDDKAEADKEEAVAEADKEEAAASAAT